MQKSKFWQNKKKCLEILSFYTCVPQMMIIWCLVTDISSIAHIIFIHFRLFFTLLPPWQLKKSKFWKNEKHSWRHYHFTHDYHKSKSYNVWLRYGTWQTEFFLILDHFLPFYPYSPLTTQNQKFEKMKQNPGDIIILHKFTINYNHLIYGSWDINCNRQIF